MKSGRIFSSVCAAALAFVGVGAGITPVAATSGIVYTIGVDNAAPRGHDWLYVDYFPRQGLTVPQGSVLDFKWNEGSIDGFHTATLLARGASGPPPELASAIVPDDDSPTGLMANPVADFPNSACGDTAGTACLYDGSTAVNSGGNFNAGGADFFVKVSSPGTVKFICLIHPGMEGSINVAPAGSQPVSSPADALALAAAQHDSDTVAARAAEAAANSRSVITNPDGSHTVTTTVGVATPFVEIAQMLPKLVEVRPGDHIVWVTKTIKELHTVTFPLGSGSDPIDPFQFVCVPGDPDAGPGGCEFHLGPGLFPVGGQTITGGTVATSGVLGIGFPTSYRFDFPVSGTFTYMCRIHPSMTGTVFVTSGT